MRRILLWAGASAFTIASAAMAQNADQSSSAATTQPSAAQDSSANDQSSSDTNTSSDSDDSSAARNDASRNRGTRPDRDAMDRDAIRDRTDRDNRSDSDTSREQNRQRSENRFGATNRDDLRLDDDRRDPRSERRMRDRDNMNRMDRPMDRDRMMSDDAWDNDRNDRGWSRDRDRDRDDWDRDDAWDNDRDESRSRTYSSSGYGATYGIDSDAQVNYDNHHRARSASHPGYVPMGPSGGYAYDSNRSDTRYSSRFESSRYSDTGSSFNVHGRLRSIASADSARDGDALHARIESDSGHLYTISLGQRDALQRVDIQPGDRVTLRGSCSAVDADGHLIASTLEFQGQTIALGSDGMSGEQFAAREIRGEIIATRTETIRGEQHLLARVRTESDRIAVIDLGSQQNLSDLQLREGARVTLRAHRAMREGRRALVASEIRANGRTITIDRDRDMRLQGQPVSPDRDMNRSDFDRDNRMNRSNRDQDRMDGNDRDRNRMNRDRDQNRSDMNRSHRNDADGNRSDRSDMNRSDRTNRDANRAGSDDTTDRFNSGAGSSDERGSSSQTPAGQHNLENRGENATDSAEDSGTENQQPDGANRQ